MGEKASIFQGVQIGIQAVAGTPVAAGKKLLAVSVTPGMSVEADSFRPDGNKFSSFVTLNKDWSTHDIKGKNTYNEVLYLLASLLGQPVPTQQGATTAYKWVFGSNVSAEDAGKLLTVEQGDANSAWRAPDVRVSGLTFTFNRKEVSVSGSGIGGPMEPGVTMTATPTSMTPRPILPAHGKFYMADTQAGLAGAVAMTRGFSAEFALTDLVGLAWPVGGDPVLVEKEPKLAHKLKLAADIVGMGLITTMRNGATKWFRLLYEGAIIADTYKYTFQVDFPAQLKDLSKPGDEDGLAVFEYGLQGIYDATWGKAFEISVITDAQSL